MGLLYTVSPCAANGRIWDVSSPANFPRADARGLVLALQQPCPPTSSAVRPPFTTAVALDADHLAAVDARGNVHVFHMRQNRVVRLDMAGAAGTCAAFSHGPGRKTLFVGFEVGVCRCKGVGVGLPHSQHARACRSCRTQSHLAVPARRPHYCTALDVHVKASA